MAKKYVNFRVGGSPQKVNEDYSVWTNDLLGKVIASKTVIQPGRSTVGHKLVGIRCCLYYCKWSGNHGSN